MAQLMSRSPHWAATLRPVADEPVNMMKSVCSMSGVPSSAPRPVTTWRRPCGSPASSSRPAAHSVLNGVEASGLITTPLPAASAGSASPIPSVNG